MTGTIDSPGAFRRAGKSATAFRTISEVADDLDVPSHVLRFWETKFTQIRPLKRGGGRRYYRPEDVDLLRRIRELLYRDGYTIKGVQRLLRDRAAKPDVGEALTPEPPRRSGAMARSSVAEAAEPAGLPRRPDIKSLVDELVQLKALLAEARGRRA
jgi:DNA-binding transcriptional MerR regulator